jgi:hypothetical protein
MRSAGESYAPGAALREDDRQHSLFGGHDQPRVTQTAPRIANRAPIAAKRDPITSMLAAQDLTLSGARSAKKRELVEFLRTRSEPLTSFEISAAIGWDRHEAAKRLPDARRDGLLENGDMRLCRITGRLAMTWRAVRL